MAALLVFCSLCLSLTFPPTLPPFTTNFSKALHLELEIGFF